MHGDIETPRLFIDKGAVFDGRCSMGDGRVPERHPLSGEQLLDELGRDASSDPPPPSEARENVDELEDVPELFDAADEEDTRVTDEPDH